MVQYKGHVMNTTPGSPEWYNIKYENDKAVYLYDLLHDYKEGWKSKVIISSLSMPIKFHVL